jgi:hypothetical protein
MTGLQVMQVIRDGLGREGPMFLMKGWTPAWLRLTYAAQSSQSLHVPLTVGKTAHRVDFCDYGEVAGVGKHDGPSTSPSNGLRPGVVLHVPKSGRLDQLSQSKAAASSQGYMLSAGSNSLLTLLSASTIWSSDMDEN